jgi:hypothetical protein
VSVSKRLPCGSHPCRRRGTVHGRWLALLILCGVFATALVASPRLGSARAATTNPPQPCKEVETTKPSASGAKNLTELQPNAARPTFDVKLDYSTSGDDYISFTPKAGGKSGATANVAAEFTDAPRFKGDRLTGDAFIAAHASKSGRRVVVYACFENLSQYTAGRYQGTVALFGPQLADFTYAIVITTKWPRWIALVTILVTVIGALFIGFVTNTFSRPANRRDGMGWLRVIIGFIIATALGALPYWSVYASNETWGSTPPSDLTALVTATFTAAVGGLALAAKILSAPAN